MRHEAVHADALVCSLDVKLEQATISQAVILDCNGLSSLLCSFKEASKAIEEMINLR